MNETVNSADSSSLINKPFMSLQKFIDLNYDVSLLLGLILHPILLFLILKRSPTNLLPYRPLLLISALTDGYAIVCFGFIQPIFRSINGLNLIVFRGFAKYLSVLGHWIAYSFLMTCMLSEVCVLCLETWFRFRFLKTRNALPKRQLLIFILIILFLVTIQFPVFLYDYTFFITEETDYHELWPQSDPTSIIIVRNSQRHVIFKLFLLYRSIITFGSFVLTIVISAASVWVMHEEVENMSKRTKELLSQFTNTLITRILLYGFTNILPLAISYLTMFFTINSPILDITTTITFIWFPALNTIFSLIFIRAYRNIILQSFGLCFKGLSFQQSSQNSMTRS